MVDWGKKLCKAVSQNNMPILREVGRGAIGLGISANDNSACSFYNGDRRSASRCGCLMGHLDLMKICKFRKLWLIVGVFAAVGFPHAIPQSANAQAATEVGSVFRDCYNCPEMIVIPAGKFLMGSSPEESARDIEEAPISYAPTVRKVVLTEQPQHEVTINSPFALAKYPVTRNEFGAFVEETGYVPASGCVLAADNYKTSSQANWRAPGFVQTEQDPAVCVNWQDAKAYIGWLNKKLANSTNSAAEGPYRLPSEAEWEYAARAGTRTARWWGDPIGRSNAVCARCGTKWDQTRTAPVGNFQPNPFGLYDMLGNVSQWAEDCWNESYNAAPVDGRPWETGNCDRRLARGGDWISFPWVLRSATRSGSYRDHRYNSGGFRVAKTLIASSR